MCTKQGQTAATISEQSAKPSKSTEYPRQRRQDHAPWKGCWKGERAKRRCLAQMIRGWKRRRLDCLKPRRETGNLGDGTSKMMTDRKKDIKICRLTCGYVKFWLRA